MGFGRLVTRVLAYSIAHPWRYAVWVAVLTFGALRWGVGSSVGLAIAAGAIAYGLTGWGYARGPWRARRERHIQRRAAGG